MLTTEIRTVSAGAPIAETHANKLTVSIQGAAAGPTVQPCTLQAPVTLERLLAEAFQLLTTLVNYACGVVVAIVLAITSSYLTSVPLKAVATNANGT